MYKDRTIFLDLITNAETLGQVLYTHYFFFFILAGLILLIVLIGAVTLTKKKKKNNIDFFSQLSRNYMKSTFNIKKQP